MHTQKKDSNRKAIGYIEKHVRLSQSFALKPIAIIFSSKKYEEGDLDQFKKTKISIRICSGRFRRDGSTKIKCVSCLQKSLKNLIGKLNVSKKWIWTDKNVRGAKVQSYEMFSRRNKTFQYDLLQYDYLPEKLRTQIYYIWKYSLAIERGKGNTASVAARTFSAIRDAVCMEHGLQKLHSDGYNPAAECQQYLLHGPDMDILLDLIEVSMRAVEHLWAQYDSQNKRQLGLNLNHKDAPKALNQRFRENGVGYEFTDGILIQKDSEILHEEVTKPALYLLQEQEFKGALEEFLQAHDHYRKGHYSDSILNAGKAFESTMKTIADKEGWGLTGRENASNLVALLITNGVIPDYLQTTLLALATLRNKVAGHGQGAEPVAVPEHFVNYALHLCGTNIVMLIEAYKNYSK